MYELKDLNVNNEIENKIEDFCEFMEQSFCELTEQSFYPPQDTRVYTSGIDDIEGGDSFSEYAGYFWETYGCELYDDLYL